MGLIKGGLALTRYRVTEPPPAELTDDYIRDRLMKNAFIDIEHSAEEQSLGWVEFLDHLKWDFDPAACRFGGILAFTLRLDQRRLSSRTLNRYYAFKEAEFTAQNGRPPTSQAKRALKETVHFELMRRVLLDTELMEVAWLYGENEVWLAAAGEKRREVFEELWLRTFGLSLIMLVPATLGLELLPPESRPALRDSKPAAIWLGQ